MEIPEETRKDRRSIAQLVKELQEKVEFEERAKTTEQETRKFRWPFRWRRKIKTAKRATASEIMVVYLNKKNEIEVPKFMPIFDGNMVIYKNKPYEFDPRAVWTMKGFKGNPKVYLIKEIDRRPVKNKFNKFFFKDAAVSNMDLDEIRVRGDSTESDEFLIKAALRAQKAEMSKKKIGVVAILAIVVVVGLLLYFFLS